MSYKSLRYVMREMSLNQLERMRHALIQSQRAASPAHRVRIDNQLEIVETAISRAYAVIQLEESACA